MADGAFCRIAFTVADYGAVKAALSDCLGMKMVDVTFNTSPLLAGLGEHGIEPIQFLTPLDIFKNFPQPLFEIAYAFDDCEAVRESLAEEGVIPLVESSLHNLPRKEYLYADFCGAPTMICTHGDSMALMGLREPKDSPPPKIACVTMEVPSIDDALARYRRHFGFAFTEADPADLGSRAVVGSHGIRLVEKPLPLYRSRMAGPVLSLDIVVDDIEAAHAKLAAYPAPQLATRPVRGGTDGRYYGNALAGIPLSLFDARDEHLLLSSGPN